jgi:hypothetical protein
VILADAPLLLARGILQEFLHFDPSALQLEARWRGFGR